MYKFLHNYILTENNLKMQEELWSITV